MDISSVTRHLSRVRPIYEHSTYTPALEYSDKLILPLSFFAALCRAGTHSPPLLHVTSLRHKTRSTLCGVLDFSAEEDTVYCPAEVLRTLGCYSAFHIKGGLALTSLQQPLPRLHTVWLYSPVSIEEAQGREALLQYTVLKTGDSKKLWLNGQVVSVQVSHLQPASSCVLLDSGFDLHVQVGRLKLLRTQTRFTRRETKRVRLKTPRALQIKRLSISKGKTASPRTFEKSTEVISFRVSVKRVHTRFLK